MKKLYIDLPTRIKNVKKYIEKRTEFEVVSVRQIELQKPREVPMELREKLFNKGNFNRYDIDYNSECSMDRRRLEILLSPCNLVGYSN